MRRSSPVLAVALLVLLATAASAQATTFTCGSHSFTQSTGTFAISPATTGDCSTVEDIPSTLTVTITGQVLTMGNGTTNAGTIDFVHNSSGDLNGGVTSSGSITNSGTIRDDATALRQSIDVQTLTNTGTIDAAAGGGLLALGTTAHPEAIDDHGTLEATGAGNVNITNENMKLENGASTSTPAPAQFVLQEADTLDVSGGSFGGGVNPSAMNLTFEPSAGASTGSLRSTSDVNLTGTMPAGWTVSLSGAALHAADGSGNAGTIDFVDDLNSGVDGPGTFTNSGLIRDDSPGHGQGVDPKALVNTGTIDSEGPGMGLGTTSTAETVDNSGTIKVGAAGGFNITNETFKNEPSGTVTAPSAAQLTLGVATTLDIAGGTFGPGSNGTAINLTYDPGATGAVGSLLDKSDVNLTGTIPAGWSLTLAGASLNAADGSANAGTIGYGDGNAGIQGAGTFTNAGQIVVGTTSGAKQVNAKTFVDSGGISIAAGAALGTTGSVQLAPSSVVSLGVTNATTFGQWNVGGPVALGGTLAVSQAPGYTPAATDALHVVTDYSQTGTFGSVTGARGLVASYAGGGVTLAPASATTPPPATTKFRLTKSLVSVKAPSRKATKLALKLKGVPAKTKLTAALTLAKHKLTAHATASSKGTATITLRISKKLRTTLRSKRTKSLRLVVTATPPGVAATHVTITLKLK